MVVINNKEGRKKFEELKKNAEESLEKDFKKRLNILGLNEKDKDIRGIIGELRRYFEYEKVLEKTSIITINKTKGIHRQRVLKRVMDKLQGIKNSSYFYVTLAYMKKQERLNRKVINLTRLVIILMIIQIIIIVSQFFCLK